jgi:hypothetical protein
MLSIKISFIFKDIILLLFLTLKNILFKYLLYQNSQMKILTENRYKSKEFFLEFLLNHKK